MIGKPCFIGLIVAVLQLQTVYSQIFLSDVLTWNTMRFNYETPAQEQVDIDSGLYNKNVTAPVDVDAEVTPAGVIKRFFITIPRFMGGSPVTLGVVSGSGHNLSVSPYPDWSWHRPVVCGVRRLISVYRTAYQKECNTLWVLDTGIFGDTIRCPPKIVAFNLTSNEVFRTIIIPPDLYEFRSILVTIVVETLNSCLDTFVYVADCQAYSIIVHDVSNNRTWRVIDKTMYPSPECGTIKIQNENFELMDGVLGMALKQEISGNKLFFNALSSPWMNWVYTSHLQNESLVGFPESVPQVFNTYKTVRPSQSTALAIDSNGVSYAGLVEESSLVCWNTNSSEYGTYLTEFYRNQTTMQFPTGVKIISDSRGEHLFIVTARLQKIFMGSFNPNELNFRVSAVSTRYIYPTTKCNTTECVGTPYYSTSPCRACNSSRYRLRGYPGN